MRFANGWAIQDAALAPLLEDLPPDPGLWIGYSLGGMRLLAELASGRSAPPEALVLIGSTLSFCQRETAPYGTPRAQLRGIRSGLAKAPDKVLATFARHCFAPGRPPAWDQVLDQDIDALTAGCNDLMDLDLTQLVFPDMPVLILHGTEDEVTAPEAATALATALGTRARFAAGAGHALPITHPEWCAEQILAFLHK